MFKKRIGDKLIKNSNKESLAKFEEQKQFVDSIIEAGEQWTDPDFPPEFESLCTNGSNAQFNKCKAYEWKRLSEMYPDGDVFKDGTEPGDIKQGELGDCYYLCTLASMAEVPERVYDRFITQEKNDAGIYLVTLFVNGVETPVILDDWIPTKYDQPAFAKAAGDEFWVCLLEKAWAKVHGCYTVMEGGFPLMASLHLQGVPGYELQHADYKEEEAKV